MVSDAMTRATLSSCPLILGQSLTKSQMFNMVPTDARRNLDKKQRASTERLEENWDGTSWQQGEKRCEGLIMEDVADFLFCSFTADLL
jgi:hypothetical protein